MQATPFSDENFIKPHRGWSCYLDGCRDVFGDELEELVQHRRRNEEIHQPQYAHMHRRDINRNSIREIQSMNNYRMKREHKPAQWLFKKEDLEYD